MSTSAATGYTVDQFTTDREAVQLAYVGLRSKVGQAEEQGTSLELAERLQRMYVEGRQFWMAEVAPKNAMHRGRPVDPASFHRFGSYLAKTGTCQPRWAYELEAARQMLDEFFARAQIKPMSARQVRPLTRLAKLGFRDRVPEVWHLAVDAYGSAPSAQQVQQTVKDWAKANGVQIGGGSRSRTPQLTTAQRAELETNEIRAHARRLFELDLDRADQVLHEIVAEYEGIRHRQDEQLSAEYEAVETHRRRAG